jgi:CRP/FNR family transcriptional regulator, cyclic AMP receptor protein
MTLAEGLGYVASLLVFLTFCMRTMIPLRIAAIGSNVAFIAYAGLGGLYPILILHALLLPMNIWRTVEMLRLAGRIRSVRSDELSFDWFKPFMKFARHAKGEVLFRKGDHADRLYVLVGGTVVLEEIGVALRPGSMFGEIALFSDDRLRTQTAVCADDVELFWIDDKELAQLCYQNPSLSFHLLRLITNRLIDNTRKMPAAGVAAQ